MTRVAVSRTLARNLMAKLNEVWRNPGDGRDSVAELVHSRSGTALETHQAKAGEATLESVASWAIETACAYLRDAGLVKQQKFDVIFNGTPLSFWIAPENLQDDSSSDAIIAGLLEDRRQLASTYTEAIGDVVKTLHDDNANLRASNNDFMRAQVANVQAMGELYKQQGFMELELRRQSRADDRWDKAATGLFSLVERAGPAAMTDFMERWGARKDERKARASAGQPAPTQPEQKKFIEDLTLKEVAESLTEEEKKVVGTIVFAAWERDKRAAADAEAAKSAEAANAAEAAKTNGGAANGAPANGATNPDRSKG